APKYAGVVARHRPERAPQIIRRHKQWGISEYGCRRKLERGEFRTAQRRSVYRTAGSRFPGAGSLGFARAVRRDHRRCICDYVRYRRAVMPGSSRAFGAYVSNDKDQPLMEKWTGPKDQDYVIGTEIRATREKMQEVTVKLTSMTF